MGHYLYTPGCAFGRCCAPPAVVIDPGTKGTTRRYGDVSTDPGNGIWIRNHNSDDSLTYEVYGVAVDSSGNVYSTGQPDIYDSDNTLRKYDTYGNLKWSSKFAGVTAYNRSIIGIDGSGYIFECRSTSGGDGLRKVDPATGIDEWSITNSSIKETGGMAINSSGNVFIVSTTNEDILEFSGSTGSLTTTHTIDWQGDDTSGGPLCICTDGTNFYLGGSPSEYDAVTPDWKNIEAFDSSWNSLWVAKDNNPPELAEDIEQIATDGSTVATALVLSWIAAWDASDGSALWSDTGYGPSADDAAYSPELAFDSSGNVYWQRWKLDLSDGSLVWSVDHGAQIHGIAVVGDQLYLGGMATDLYPPA